MNEPIRKMIPYEEFDYQTLLGALKGYAHPRDRITTLLRKGIIIRVKKGLYILFEPTHYLTFLPARCTPFFAASGKTG